MKKQKAPFTYGQMANYRIYEWARVAGEANMFDPLVRISLGMTEKDFLFVVENYAALREQAQQEDLRDIAMAANLADRFDIHF